MHDACGGVAFLKSGDEVPPLTQKVFLFFDGGKEAHNAPLFRQLVASFEHWARRVDAREETRKLRLEPSAEPTPGSPRMARIQNSPCKPRRALSFRSSCPLGDP